MAGDRWRRVGSMYSEALERPPDERASWLLTACDGDDDLRREVEALLVYDSEPSLFDRSALDLEAAAIAQERDDLVGRSVGGYDVLAFLGAGGMGDVYRARDMRLVREVALKVFHPSRSQAPIERIEAEARAASALNHPNIVTVYGVGEDDDLAYIAMELVKGRPLRDLLASGPLALAQAADIAAQLAEAMAAAHAQSIVHGDLKPENVMVADDGRVKVLDFGIATLHREDAGPVAPGASGLVAGTRGYMAPEQAEGRAAIPASDQFAFGVMCLEMVTGRRDLREAPAAGPFGAVIVRCLQSDPARRFASSAELLGAIRAINEGGSLTRRRLLSLVTLGAAGAVAAWRFWPGAAATRSLAVLPFANPARDDNAEYLCDGIAETLITRLGRLPGLSVIARATAFSFKGAVDPRAVGQQLGVDAVLTGALSRRAGRLRVSSELIDSRTGGRLWGAELDRPADDVLAVQNDIASAILAEGLRLTLTPEQRQRLSRSEPGDPAAYEAFLLGVHHLRLGTETDYLAARASLQHAVDLAPRFTLALVTLASTYSVMAVDGYEAPAMAWPESARRVDQALAIDGELPDAYAERAASAFFHRWDWRAADRDWEKALALRSEVQSELLLSRSLMKWALGDPSTALDLSQAARQVDPLNPDASIRTADLLTALGRRDEASNLYETILRATPEDARALSGLADLRRSQGRFDDAIALRRRAHAGADDRSLEATLAGARGERGYDAMVRASAEQTLDQLVMRKVSGGFVSALDFARLHAQLGRVTEAFAHLTEALEERAAGLVMLKVDPVWHALRGDSRFAAAVAHVGIP